MDPVLFEPLSHPTLDLNRTNPSLPWPLAAGGCASPSAIILCAGVADAGRGGRAGRRAFPSGLLPPVRPLPFPTLLSSTPCSARRLDATDAPAIRRPAPPLSARLWGVGCSLPARLSATPLPPQAISNPVAVSTLYSVHILAILQ